MTAKIKQAIEVLRALPEDEQAQAAEALLTFLNAREEYDAFGEA